MKYIFVREFNNGDEYIKEFDSKEEAVKFGDQDWHHTTDSERRKCKYCYVLESDNPDEDDENHFDGNPVFTWK